MILHLVWPTYCFLQVSHVIQYITLCDLQVTFSLVRNCLVTTGYMAGSVDFRTVSAIFGFAFMNRLCDWLVPLHISGLAVWIDVVLVGGSALVLSSVVTL